MFGNARYSLSVYGFEQVGKPERVQIWSGADEAGAIRGDFKSDLHHGDVSAQTSDGVHGLTPTPLGSLRIALIGDFPAPLAPGTARSLLPVEQPSAFHPPVLVPEGTVARFVGALALAPLSDGAQRNKWRGWIGLMMRKEVEYARRMGISTIEQRAYLAMLEQPG